MSLRPLTCAYLPLVDCAPLVIARELGFAAEEGLELVLSRERSWASARDKLALGRCDAAHMLAPAVVAMSMGVGGMAAPLDALMVLSINGEAVGVSPDLAARMREAGAPDDFADAAGTGRALIAAVRASAGAAESARPLRVGVPFPFSTHAELLYYWLDALGLRAPDDLSMHTIPPPRMAEAMAAGEIDAFCVGEPWGSIAVELGAAELVLPGAAIWRFAPEKVLAVRRDWAAREDEAAAALMRATWRAARWLGDPENAMTAAEFIARPDYLDISPEIAERALTGRLVVSPRGQERRTERFLEFFGGAATFPWRSQAVWFATRLAGRMGLDRAEAAAAARRCFRPDLYRANLAALGADMPGASEKLEGALDVPTAVASSTGEMILGPDRFFDGRRFDPYA